ncbi:hypothetical protein CTI12_AA177950 [Artemisia annua]|uniref:Helitron helicase-like domain-containing protein n=1 Tax=Artemisia annua TaxID=35608 RepID=A0A2U1PAM8_ARTAN|nr:hypothetical protein CTI12_AA177950 [Artemisia annua]
MAIALFFYRFCFCLTFCGLLFGTMKENHLYLPKNVTTSPTLKLPENNDAIMHQSLNSELDDIMGVEGQNPSITKREMDFYYASRGGVVSPPPLDFFSPRRRRPARSVVSLPEHSLQADLAANDAQSSSGSMLFDTGPLSVGHATEIGSLPAMCHGAVSEKRKRCPYEMLLDQQKVTTSPDGAHIAAQPSDSRAASKKKQRQQPLRSNDACRSFAVTQPLVADACFVTQAPASSAAESVVEPLRRGNRRKACSMPGVADQVCCWFLFCYDVFVDVVHPQKRSRCLSEALAQTTGNNGQTSISCTPLTMANPHDSQSQGETTNTVEHHASRLQSIAEGSASNARDNASPPYQNIAEPSTSRTYAGTTNLHATPGVPQSQKRNARPRRTTTRRPNQGPQNIAEGSTSNAIEDASPAYEDLGDCTERCMYCNAAFWRGERLANRSYSPHVFMEPEQDPLEYIKQLLEDAAFMEHIRAYNQMFAMTSFGAAIDNTVNHGRDPYVFKVSGQIYHRIGSLCPTGDDDPKFLQLYIYDTVNEVRNRLNPFSHPDSPPLDPQVVQGLIHFLDTHNELVQMFRTARDKCAEADVPEFKIRLYSGDRPRGYELPSSNTLGAIVFDRGPESDDDPKFLQLYIYDTVNEVRNRLNPFSHPDSPPLDPQVVQGLIHFLDTHNELVQMFRTARDKCAEADVPEFNIRLYSGDRPRGYELPSSNTLGAIVFDRGPESESNYDVILEYRDGPLKRISKIHKSYMSLQFPLIFIYGQPGYHTKLMLRTANPDDDPKRVSMNAFYTYQLHPKHVLDMVAGEEKTYASYDIAIPVGNNGAETEIAMEENTKALVQLPCDTNIVESADIPQITPIRLGHHNYLLHCQIKNMLIKKRTDKEIEQGKEIHQMVIQNQETSGTPPETIILMEQKPLKTIADQKTTQDSSTRPVRRALFETQPSQSKKQKGTYHMFIQHRCSFIE